MTTESSKLRILIFTHFSEERDGESLLKDLAQALLGRKCRPDHVIFTTYQEREDGIQRPGKSDVHVACAQCSDCNTIEKTLIYSEPQFLELVAKYHDFWQALDPDATVSTTSSVEAAVKLAQNMMDHGKQKHILVTGSLHLVGAVLNIL